MNNLFYNSSFLYLIIYLFLLLLFYFLSFINRIFYQEYNETLTNNKTPNIAFFCYYLFNAIFIKKIVLFLMYQYLIILTVNSIKLIISIIHVL